MSKVEVGTAIAYLELNTKGFEQGINKAETKLKTFSTTAADISTSLSTFGSGLTKTGTLLTTGITLPILGIGTAAVKLSGDFDASMSKVQAISGATAEELDALYDKAIEMGAATKFSAQESADAFTYMAMAGWDVEDMLEGISGIMSLAAADGLDLATTSDIVTDALTAFGLQASDSAHFADVLAQASSSANTNVSMLGESFKYIAPVAGALGFSIEDVALALGLMANSGIKGTQAGTALRASLAAMTKPTDDAAALMEELGIEIANADGSMKSLQEIMQILRVAFSDLTEEEQANVAATLFGREAMSGMLAVINASEEDFNKLADSIYNADGRADEMAATMMDNLPGAIEQLTGAIESFMITLGAKMAPLIKKVAEFITLIVEKLNTLSEEQVEQIVKIAAIVATIGPLLVMLGTILTSLGSLISTIVIISGLSSSALTIAGGFIGIFAALVAWIASVSIQLGIVINNVKELMNNHEDFRDKVTEIWSKIQDKVNAAKETFNKFKEGIQKVFEYLENVKLDESGSIGDSLVSLIETLEELYVSLEPFIDKMGKLLGGKILIAISAFVGVVNGAIKTISPLIDIINGWINVFTDAANALLSFIQGDFASMEEYAQSLLDNLSGIWENVKELFTGFGEGFTEGFSETLKTLFETFGVDFEAAKEDLKEKVQRFIPELIERIKEFLDEAPGKIGEWLGGMIYKLQQFGENIITWIQEAFSSWITNAKNFLKDLPSELGEWLGEMIYKIQHFGTNVLSWIQETFLLWIENAKNFLKNLPKELGEWLSKLIYNIQQFGVNVLSWIREEFPIWIEEAKNFLKNLPEKFWQWLCTLVDKVKELGPNMLEAGREVLNKMWEGLKQTWESIKGWFEEVKQAVQDFLEGIKKGYNEAKSKAAATGALKLAGSHANGLTYVPYDGYIAELHQGERVLTKSENESYNKDTNKTNGDTYIFNSPKPIDEYEAARLLKQTKQEFELVFS